MNTHNFINGTDAYRLWAMANPNASYYEDNIAYEISKSQDFINWEYNNPNGTLSQYLDLLERQKEDYYNSPQYLKKQLEIQEESIENLTEEIYTLKSQLLYIEDEIDSIQTTNYLSVCVLFLIFSVLFIVLWKRNKK